MSTMESNSRALSVPGFIGKAGEAPRVATRSDVAVYYASSNAECFDLLECLNLPKDETPIPDPGSPLPLRGD